MSDKNLWLRVVWGPSIIQYVVNSPSRSMGEIKMIPSLKPKIVRIAIAGLVILIATLIYAIAPLWEGHFQYSEIISWQLICVLQIIGGIFLLIGSLIVRLGFLNKVLSLLVFVFLFFLKDNHCLFLPWLGSSVTFIYTIFFRSFMYLRQDPPKPESFVPNFQIIVGKNIRFHEPFHKIIKLKFFKACFGFTSCTISLGTFFKCIMNLKKGIGMLKHQF